MITDTTNMDYMQRAKANSANIKELKAGDEVFVNRSGTDYHGLATVTRVTPTQVIIGTQRFRKTNGCEIGVGRYADHLNTFVDEQKAKHKLQKRLSSALSAVKRISWDHKSVEKLEAVLAIVDEKRLDTSSFAADWKDTDYLIEGFTEAVERFGLTLTPDPDLEGSDMFGFILTNRPMTEDELKAHSIFADEDEEDESDEESK